MFYTDRLVSGCACCPCVVCPVGSPLELVVLCSVCVDDVLLVSFSLAWANWKTETTHCPVCLSFVTEWCVSPYMAASMCVVGIMSVWWYPDPVGHRLLVATS